MMVMWHREGPASRNERDPESITYMVAPPSPETAETEERARPSGSPSDACPQAPRRTATEKTSVRGWSHP